MGHSPEIQELLTMKATIEINLVNAAFDDGRDGRDELVRLLHMLAEFVARGTIRCPIRDINGNRVGEFNLEEVL